MGAPLAETLLWLTREAGRGGLTVLAYHRVADPRESGFVGFVPNVSATPQGFHWQMGQVARHFDVISQEDLSAWLAGKGPLPKRPLLITFDDGYADNQHHAWPILRQYNLPAVLFLATGHIGNARPLYWDLVAHCFTHTPLNKAHLPLTGESNLAGETEKGLLLRRFLAAAKGLTDTEKDRAVGELVQALAVPLAADTFSGLMMDWDGVRAMARGGVEMGAHTHRHPILTRIPLSQAQEEIQRSIERVTKETGHPCRTFAYPNGLAGDLNDDLRALLSQAGIETAFTLLPGPQKLSSLRQDPLAIRRILISHKDTPLRFLAKLAGAAAIKERWRSLQHWRASAP